MSKTKISKSIVLMYFARVILIVSRNISASLVSWHSFVLALLFVPTTRGSFFRRQLQLFTARHKRCLIFDRRESTIMIVYLLDATTAPPPAAEMDDTGAVNSRVARLYITLKYLPCSHVNDSIIYYIPEKYSERNWKWDYSKRDASVVLLFVVGESPPQRRPRLGFCILFAE